ncbi:aquaporin [Microbacterium sp. Mu-80]|uniref:Aquaporin n=1 Tax=Microbacterium bandirmense TaxID=3122050 RepID=A0ABU8L7W4_9MICO
MTGLLRRGLAELLGTGLLVAIVVGSGIAAQRLSTDPGLQLLENSIATALGLGVLIVLLAPVSRAHFNPVVSLADTLLGHRSGTGLPPRELAVYLLAQIAAGIVGAVAANAMFATATTISTTVRASPATFLAEIVATMGLVLLIMGLSRSGSSAPVIAAAVGAYIGAAYWFTSSTAFANPAVTIGRVFTDTFAGIASTSVLPFLAAQLLGAALAIALTVVLFPRSQPSVIGASDDGESPLATTWVGGPHPPTEISPPPGS